VLICLGDGLGLFEVPCATARYVSQSTASIIAPVQSLIHGYSPSRLHARLLAPGYQLAMPIVGQPVPVNARIHRIANGAHQSTIILTREFPHLHGILYSMEPLSGLAEVVSLFFMDDFGPLFSPDTFSIFLFFST
jgi:hypothetical protein